jgi:hypothetical protein
MATTGVESSPEEEMQPHGVKRRRLRRQPAEEDRRTFGNFTYLGGTSSMSLPRKDKRKLVTAMLGNGGLLQIASLRGAQPVPHTTCA